MRRPCIIALSQPTSQQVFVMTRKRSKASIQPATCVGFPFSASYIENVNRSTKPHENAKKKKKMKSASQETVVKEDIQQSITSSQLDPIENVSINISRKHCTRALITFRKSAVYHVSGICSFTLQSGSISVNGFSLTIGQKIKVNFPAWGAGGRIFVQLNSATTKFTFDSNEYQYPVDVMNKECAILLLEGVDRCDQEWLEAMEDFSMFHESYWLKISTAAMKTSQFHWFFKSGFIGDQDSMNAMEISMSILPPSWVTAADHICDITSHIHSKQQLVECPRVVICGAKGVGKSTCLKYVLNRLLSSRKHAAVCVLDCDVGQPEYSMPGVLSLKVIKAPNLVPSHFNVQSISQDDYSIFFGDITTKNAPEFFAKAITQLFARYVELQQQFADLGDSRSNVTSKLINTAGGTGFSVLDLDNNFAALPLIVNTDGNVRFMGAEILTIVVDIVKPTHVLQLVTHKDKVLSALNPPPASCAAAGVIALEPGRVVPSKISAADLRHLKMISYFLRDDKTLKHWARPVTNTFPVDEPQQQPTHDTIDTCEHEDKESNIFDQVKSQQQLYNEDEADDTANDETNLNDFVSVPEESRSEHKQHIHPTRSHKVQGKGNNNNNNNNNNSSSNSNDMKNLHRGAACMYIRNGAVLDPSGHIAAALINISPYTVPLDSVSLVMMQPSVVPRLLLDAFNASLVGIVADLATSSSSAESVNTDPSFAQFLQPCSCVAFVRAVTPSSDPENGSLYLTTVHDPSSYCSGSPAMSRLPDHEISSVEEDDDSDDDERSGSGSQLNRTPPARVCIIRGHGPLQLPTCMTYCPGMPVHSPYATSLTTGDYSCNEMKARGTVKRKGQQSLV